MTARDWEPPVRFVDEPAETIGQLHDRLPDGEWTEAYGYRWKAIKTEPKESNGD